MSNIFFEDRINHILSNLPYLDSLDSYVDYFSNFDNPNISDKTAFKLFIAIFKLKGFLGFINILHGDGKRKIFPNLYQINRFLNQRLNINNIAYSEHKLDESIKFINSVFFNLKSDEDRYKIPKELFVLTEELAKIIAKLEELFEDYIKFNFEIDDVQHYKTKYRNLLGEDI